MGKPFLTEAYGPMVFLPIRPKYAGALMAGTKLWEFRRKPFKYEPEVVVVYATEPVGKVLGYFSVGITRTGTPTELWGHCAEASGIILEDLLQYSGDQALYATQVHKSSIRVFRRPPPRSELPFRIPQSFRYLTEDEFLQLVKRGGRDA